MSSPSIYVADRCRVGFQERSGTFNGLLAYVIYYGPDGKIRKEVSWKSWCKLDGETAELAPRDFENVPTSGFVLNKGIRRYGWSHYSSGRSMVRLYDPRGWEFEITPDNLVMILMHVDCSKREICEDMVYAWSRGDLLLLPCSSTVFQEARSFSDLQGLKVSARDLVPGATYVTKKEESLVYLGRHMHFDEKIVDETYRRVGKKCHIFRDQNGEYLPITSVPSKIAAVDTPHCHDSYAQWLEEYLGDTSSSAIVDWRQVPVAADEKPPRPESDYRHIIPGIRCFMPDSGGFQSGTLYTWETLEAEPQKHRWPQALGREFTMSEGSVVFIASRMVDRDGSWKYAESSWRSGIPGEWGSASTSPQGYTRGSVTVNPDPESLVKLHALYENGAEKEW